MPENNVNLALNNNHSRPVQTIYTAKRKLVFVDKFAARIMSCHVYHFISNEQIHVFVLYIHFNGIGSVRLNYTFALGPF